MQRHLVSWTLFALSAWAQNQGLPVSGPFKAGFARSREGLIVLQDAGRSPNATSSITFKRTYDNSDEEWTWRVNTTEIAVPNRASDIGDENANDSQDLLVANTQWQLDWPADEKVTLQELAERRNASIAFTALISNKPSDITNRYSIDDNGDCTSLLGEECIESLAAAATSGGSVIFSGLNGCEDTLDTNDGGTDDGAGFGKIAFHRVAIAVQNISTDIDMLAVLALEPEGSANKGLRREETLFYRTSGTYLVDNSTTFDRSLSALQVLIMNFEYDGGELSDSGGPSVLCQIVDASVQQGLGGNEDDEGAAATRIGSMSTFWVTMAFVLAITT